MLKQDKRGKNSIQSQARKVNVQAVGLLEMNTLYKKHRGGSMRTTILPWAIVLSKACMAAVSMMAKECVV